MKTVESKPAGKTDGDQAALGLGRDLSSVKVNGAASLAELKEFLERLRGRSPQEVVGLVSSSLLIQSVALATAITLGIVAIFTIVPYLLSGPPQERTASKPPAATASKAPEEADAASTPAAAAPPAALASEPDAAKAVRAMGEDDTKLADPKTNPLDSKLDKLLDGIE